ncbi:MAG: hypothetical protein ABI905_07015 [Betaproteobacteria bacterium]
MRRGIKFFIMMAAALFISACAQPGTGVYRNDITDDMTARVLPGQASAEVTANIGTPYRRVRFDNLKATAWDYLYRDTWGYWVEFAVMVGDDDRVVNKVSRRIDPPSRD